MEDHVENWFLDHVWYIFLSLFHWPELNSMPLPKGRWKNEVIICPGRKENVFFEHLSNLFFWGIFQFFPHIECTLSHLASAYSQVQISRSPSVLDMDLLDSVTCALKNISLLFTRKIFYSEKRRSLKLITDPSQA